MYVCYRSVIWCHKNWMLVILFDWWSGLVILGNSLTHTHTHTHSLTHTHTLSLVYSMLSVDLQTIISWGTGYRPTEARLTDWWENKSWATRNVSYSLIHTLTLTHPPTHSLPFSHSYFQLSCSSWGRHSIGHTEMLEQEKEVRQGPQSVNKDGILRISKST